MQRLSVNEITTFRWSFEEDVANYAAAGFTAIGIWRQKLSDYGLDRAVELLREHKLKVSNFCWAGGFTGSDGRTFRESMNDAIEAIQTAGQLGATTLVVYSGARAGHTANHAKRLIYTALCELLPIAEEFGVNLALEPMHPECAADWTILTSLDETLAILDQVNSPHVQLVFDTYHLGFDEAAINRIEEIVDRVAVVHLGDGKPPRDGEQNRCFLGRGEIPLDKIVHRLLDAGYQGYFDVELIGEELESCNYRDLLASSKLESCRLITGYAD